jgi:hypothetical protein
LDDVRSWLSLPNAGTIETAGAPFWRLLPDGVTVATIRRPLDEVLASLRRGGLTFDDTTMLPLMQRQDRKLVQLAHRLPNVLQTTFAELGTEEGCARLFEHCLPFRHDHAWWSVLAPINVQINLLHGLHYYRAHQRQLEALRQSASHAMLHRIIHAPVRHYADAA